MTILRLSPSGPEILNVPGGGLEFGPGAFLRTVETQGAGADLLLTPALQPFPLIASTEPNLEARLSNPSAKYGYLVESQIDVVATDVSEYTLTCSLFASFDGFVTPGILIAQVQHEFGFVKERSAIQMRSLLRGDVFAGGIPDGTAELTVRLELAAPDEAAAFARSQGTDGAAWIRLVETF